MQLLITIIICLLLLSITYMDFKENAVQLFLFGGLLFSNIAYSMLSHSIALVMKQTFINSSISLLIVTILYAYYSVKEKSFGRFFNRKIGVGDILFWLSITPLFSAFNYILFFITSLLLVLVIMIMVRLINERIEFVPLAGYQSLFLLGIILLNAFLTKHALSVDIFHFQPVVLSIETGGSE